MILCSSDRQRSAILKNHDLRLADRCDSFKQLLLIIRKIEIGAVEAFAGDSLPFPKREDRRSIRA